MTEEKNPQSSPDRKRRPLPLWLLILQQLVLTGLVLCLFATFHHVLPRYLQRAPGSAATPPPALADQTPAPVPTADAAPEPTPEPEPTEPPFNPFTEEIIRTDRSYTSPTLAITITEYVHTEARPKLSYYVADVYVKSVEQLTTAVPLNQATFQSPLHIAQDNHAVLAVNADNAVGSVFSVRNGVLHKKAVKVPGDICVIYRDGSMEILSAKGYDTEEVLADDPWQVLCFGPALLDAEGHALKKFKLDRSRQVANPRTVLGYYEPGHYCLVVIDGRDLGHSLGATIQETAEIMEELGCSSAYNLDGGASSVMVWKGNLLNKPRKTRYLADMIVLRELGEEAVP